MNPLLVVTSFEFRYHLRQPTSLLFAALIFGQGVWYTYQPDNLYLVQSSAIQAYTIFSSLGIALATVAILLAGQSLTKDSAYKTTAYLYTLPITSRTHFAGRFLGTLSWALLLAILYPFGILFTLAITATPEPFSLIALADGFVWLVIPNVFICVSITFSSTVSLRGIWGAYVCLFLAVLYFLLTDNQTGTGVYADSWQLLDPFAVGMIRESIDKMPFLLTSDSLLSFSDVLLINRLLWIGLALGALAQAEARFSFDTFATKTPNQKPVAERSAPTIHTRRGLQAVQLQFEGWVPLQTTLRVAQLECQSLIRQPIFQLIVGLLILLTLLLATVFNLNLDFPELPVTSRMTALRAPMGLFIGLFLLVITGELIFQERTVGFWPIFDALPQPDVVLLVGKLLALIGIAALLTVVLFLTGVGLQLSNGFSDIDWSLYRDDLLMDGFFRYCQLIILGACVAVLVNNRLISHIINLLIFSLLAFGYQANSPDQQRWLYSFLPGSTAYSDLIGYGTQAPVRLTLHSIWVGDGWSLAMPAFTHLEPGRFGWPASAYEPFSASMEPTVHATHAGLFPDCGRRLVETGTAYRCHS